MFFLTQSSSFLHQNPLKSLTRKKMGGQKEVNSFFHPNPLHFNLKPNEPQNFVVICPFCNHSDYISTTHGHAFPCNKWYHGVSAGQPANDNFKSGLQALQLAGMIDNAINNLRSLLWGFRDDHLKLTICIVYLSLLLDNVLLTMVVPIMPDFLLNSGEEELHEKSYPDLIISSHVQKNESLAFRSALDAAFDLNSENGKVGLLLSSKALVQLLLNPLIGVVTTRMGYHLPLFVGTCLLLLSAVIFAFGGGYLMLFLARSLQGVASSCIGITGMCLVAEKYPNEPDRSKMMGFVLGSVAVGVLIGYPFGGFMYEWIGKPAPFLVVGFFVCVNGALQLCSSDLKPAEEKQFPNVGWLRLLEDKKILLTGCAIGISTSAIAVLEPCLPIWLLKEIKPKKWQLGTAFIPDSLGYVIGTNSAGAFAYRMGRWKFAMPAMVLVGLSAILVPSAKTMTQLVVPHFFLGFGIGAVDAALVPLLAALVDRRYTAHYGTVYAMQQMAVSLAYSLGPVLGSEIARSVGFPWMMRIFGAINILYSPILLLLERLLEENEEERKIVNYKKSSGNGYQRFSECEISE